MAAGCSVQITDKDGWRKAFPLDKTLVHIGSDSRNDIVLDARHGEGVAARHLQLITLLPASGLAAASSPTPACPGSQARGYRVVNLGGQDVAVGNAQTSTLPPRSALEIADGMSLQVGEFTLVFQLGEASAGPGPAPAEYRSPWPDRPGRQGGAQRPPAIAVTRPERTSAAIGLSLALPDQPLDPESPLEGIVTVRNQGHEPGVQFRLELEGLQPDCYDMGPGPILFPNVEKGVPLRLHHPRRPSPPAGPHVIRVRATAPDGYPGESAVVSRELQILPYYSHTVRLEPLS
jgi:hypothetical protein